MKPVYQDRFGLGQGNCAWACVASLFEISLDDLRFPPPTDDNLREWTNLNMPDTEFHYRDLGFNYRVVEGYPDVEGVGTGRWAYDLPDEWDPPAADYWLASVNSLGLKRPVEDSYYPMPALHMVVMRGRDLVHDPNPKYAARMPYTPTVVAQSWWTKKTP